MRNYQRSMGGVLVPERLAPQIGIGCPKCDKYFLQSTALGQTSDLAQKFIHDHMKCGRLDALEMQDGKLVCTGPVQLQFMQ
jgi:hypothetical protein